ncbi:hypothetical protein Val02_92060 [Virgisporangium aliadipatigenens]|uniref:Uncharacterized protein n=1 Tax=Virgisporangium aliadipatigenens TaxID=741659 RepID=A0A8J3YYY6_9ACTN|nr:hypothetical protein [Virgisporangium aliadipatigenens]GIJ52320.1 hypothetical protein Val02_92060 [Virgisporangium aliadipatigenens]
MTQPLSRRLRLLGATATTGLLAALVAPALSITPAAATPNSDPECAKYGAASAGDVLTLRLLDLRPLGIQLPPTADVQLAAARAGLSGEQGFSAAQARYGQARVLGTKITGPLDLTAYQIAPPSHPGPDHKTLAKVDLGSVGRIGAGELTAGAKYHDNRRCDAKAGAESNGTAALVDAHVLPGPRAVLQAGDNIGSGARTALIKHRGGTGAEAVSVSNLANLSLLGAVQVKVVSKPVLRVVAGGTKERSVVDYSAPKLSVELPGGRVELLDNAAESVDLAVPVNGGFVPNGMPVAAPNALAELLAPIVGAGDLSGTLNGVLGAGKPAPVEGGKLGVDPSAGSAQPPALPGLNPLQGVPAVGGLLGNTAPLSTPAGKSAVVLRLTAGELSKEVNDAGVHAKAISLRLKLVLVCGNDTTTLLDLALGTMEVAATAGKPGHGGYDGPPGQQGDEPAGEEPNGETPLMTQPPAPRTTPVNAKSKLPVTGMNITGFIGAGVVLVIVGRLLMVASRRRGAGNGPTEA